MAKLSASRVTIPAGTIQTSYFIRKQPISYMYDKNPQFHGRCKHIAIKYHCIRDEARKGTINVQYCRTDDMIADIFKTKILNLRRSRD